jgi:hypothetical protein
VLPAERFEVRGSSTPAALGVRESEVAVGDAHMRGRARFVMAKKDLATLPCAVGGFERSMRVRCCNALHIAVGSEHVGQPAISCVGLSKVSAPLSASSQN